MDKLDLHIHTGTAGSFFTITFSHFQIFHDPITRNGMLPFLNFVLIEFEKTRVSCTQPGHLVDTSVTA